MPKLTAIKPWLIAELAIDEWQPVRENRKVLGTFPTFEAAVAAIKEAFPGPVTEQARVNRRPYAAWNRSLASPIPALATRSRTSRVSTCGKP